MNKKIIGNFGEQVSKKYLQDKGYLILETNWHYHHKELDIIAYKHKLVAFEIKTRKNNNNLSFTVLKSQQVGRLRLSLRAYCLSNGYNYSNSRLDLIVVTIKNSNTISLKHCLDI